MLSTGVRLSCLHHFRGHGVHSPFVYGLVREVFMRRRLLAGNDELLQALLQAGVGRRQAIQLQNIATHCAYRSCVLNGAEADFCLITPQLTVEQTENLTARASQAGHTVAILRPYTDAQRATLCRKLIAAHPSTSIDKGAYMLIFNNNLPKQHFRI